MYGKISCFFAVRFIDAFAAYSQSLPDSRSERLPSFAESLRPRKYPRRVPSQDRPTTDHRHSLRRLGW